MLYTSTEAGRQALLIRQALTLRERQILMLCNGTRPLGRLHQLLGPGLDAELQSLLARGLLAPVQSGAPADAQTPWHTTQPTPHESTVPLHTLLLDNGDEGLLQSPGAQLQTLAQALRQGGAHVPEWARQQLQARLAGLDEAYASQKPDLITAQHYMGEVLALCLQGSMAQRLQAHQPGAEARPALQFLAQGLGVLLSLGGPTPTLHVAARLSQLLPVPRRAQLLDHAMDYVPTDFNLPLYEAVLPRSTAANPGKNI